MTATLNLPEGLSFTLPKGLEATEPPEERGLARDEVRLLVAAETLTDRTFLDLPEVLEPGDLLVVNTSATLPAAVPADGGNLLVHLGTQLPGGLWLVELRQPAGAGSLPYFNGRSGQHLALPDGGGADLLAPYPIATGVPARLWYAALVRGAARRRRPSSLPRPARAPDPLWLCTACLAAGRVPDRIRR